MMFHVITEGQCWLEVDGADRCLLQPGTLALVPHGQGHRLISDVGAAPVPLFDAPREFVSDRYEVVRLGGGGRRASMLCGLVRFDHPAAADLIRLLPKVIRMEVTSSPQADWLQSTLRLVAAEASALRAGGEAVIVRLADILVLETIRWWITRDPGERVGWLGALRDRQIGQAISLVQRDPTRHWTVGALAGAVGMSRSAFSARFTRLVGKPVMHYVTEWKMHSAQLSLAHDGQSLGEIADRLGYSTEAAFSRAFKRITGRSPGSWKNVDEKQRSMDVRQL
jgi:AraC-like DNA-binding protein